MTPQCGLNTSEEIHPISRPAQELLENNSVYGLEFIFAELLQGAKGKREVDTILALANLIPSLDEPFHIIDSDKFHATSSTILSNDRYLGQ